MVSAAAERSTSRFATATSRTSAGATSSRHPDGKPVRFGNGVEFWAGAHDCLVEGCRLWEIYDAALTNQGSGTNVQENITYRRNVIWNSEYSFEYWNRDQASGRGTSASSTTRASMRASAGGTSSVPTPTAGT